MTGGTFRSFTERLIGAWSGYRRSAAREREPVRSLWCSAFDGTFLREQWMTSGDGDDPAPTADAFFRVADSGPGDFVAVYASGGIAFGESAFDGSEWSLTHRWLRDPGVAVVHLRLLDDDTYEQEVVAVAPDGSPTVESFTVMKRDPNGSRRPDPRW